MTTEILEIYVNKVTNLPLPHPCACPLLPAHKSLPCITGLFSFSRNYQKSCPPSYKNPPDQHWWGCSPFSPAFCRPPAPGPHCGQMFASALLQQQSVALRSTKGWECLCLRALSQIDSLLLLRKHLTGAEMFIFKVGDAASVTVLLQRF